MNIVRHYIDNNRKRKAWIWFIFLLAAATMAVTVGVLVHPASTMAGVTYCGYEEHTAHTESCYAEVETLICDQSTEGHTHTDACYAEESVLTCGLEESAGHIHSDACYDENGELICGMEEGEGAHYHDDSCYSTERCLICGLEESAPHEHTAECYAVTRELVCDLPLHEHTLQCYSDPDADVETPDEWEETFSDIEWSEDNGENVAAIAATQLGYTESSANYLVQDDGVTVNGYTRYGAWNGEPYADWNCLFSSFCMYYAGIASDTIPYGENVADWTTDLSEWGLYRGDIDQIAVGDIVFLDTDEDGLADASAVVEKTAEDTLDVIRGDADGCVTRESWEINDVIGYIDVAQAEAEETPAEETPVEETPVEETSEEETSEEENFVQQTIMAVASDGAGVVISGSIPQGAEVVIEPVALTEEEAAAYTDAENGDTVSGFAAYDISILVDGAEWHPETELAVSISSPEVSVQDAETVGITHVDDDGVTENCPAEIGENGDISFTADGFSLYVLYTYTVDDYASELAAEEDLLGTDPVADGAAANYIEGYNMTGSGTTEWQITKEQYVGNAHSNKTAVDSDGDGKTDIYLQKNVVPTDTENEFLVYLSIDTKTTWEKFLNDASIGVTTSNSYANSTGQIFSDIHGNFTEAMAPHGQQGSYSNQYYIKFNIYQDHSSSTPLYTYYDWRYGHTPNCSKATATLYISGLGYIPVGLSVNLHKGDSFGTGNPFELNLYLSDFQSAVDFSLYNTVLKTVVDTMGKNITLLGVEKGKYDGTYTISDDDRTIYWTPTVNTAASTTYYTSPTSGWNENVAQLVYRVRLDVESDGFKSCADTLSSKTASITAGESFAVNSSAVLTYNKEALSNSSVKSTYGLEAEFPIPEVRGLLYDISLIKRNEEGRQLKNAVFGLYEADGTTPVMRDDKPYTITTTDTGVSVFSDLPVGKYTVKEISAPKYYKLPDTSSWTIELNYTKNGMTGLETDPENTHNLRYKALDKISYTDSGYKTMWAVVDPRMDYEYTIEVIKKDQAGRTLSGAGFTATNPAKAGSVLEKITDSEGICTFDASYKADTEYVLTETDPPDGYNALPSAIKFKINEDKTNDIYSVVFENEDDFDGKVTMELVETEEDGEYTFKLVVTVINTTGYELPSTGGCGTLIFTLAGTVLLGVTFTAGLLIYKKKEG